MNVRAGWNILMMMIGLLGLGSNLAQAQNWKPAIGDAYRLYDVAEDLHDRAQKFRDVRALAATANLEHLTSDLYQLLKHKACASEVVTTLNAVAVALQEADMLVSLSCELRVDRKAMSKLADTRLQFQKTSELIQCALEQVNIRPSSIQYEVNLPRPHYAPFGFEAQGPAWYSAQPAGPRSLPRVLVTGVR